MRIQREHRRREYAAAGSPAPHAFYNKALRGELPKRRTLLASRGRGCRVCGVCGVQGHLRRASMRVWAHGAGGGMGVRCFGGWPRKSKPAALRRPQPTSGRARAPREGCERLFWNDRDAPNHAIEGGASAELASRLLGHPRVSGMARRVVRLNGPGDVCGPRRDHDEDLTENGDDGGASLDLGVAAAPRDEHLPRGRFRWRSRGPRSAKSPRRARPRPPRRLRIR